MKKILFCPINGIGLGHVKRCLCIAEAIRNKSSDTTSFFLSNTLFPQIVVDAGFPILTFPQIWKDVSSNLDSSIKYSTTHCISENLAKELFHNILKSIAPSVTIFDPPLYSYQIQMAKKVESLTIGMLRQNSGFFNEIAEKENLDNILRPSSPYSSFDNEIGHIFQPPKPELGKELRTRYFRDNKLNILVCNGGGGQDKFNCSFIKKAGHTFLEAVEKGLSRHLKSGRVNVTFIEGPYSKHKINPKHKDFIQLVNYESELASLMGEADLVISTAGYNSVHESFLSQVPVVLMPIEYDVESQEQNIISGPGIHVIKKFDPYALDCLVDQFIHDDKFRAQQSSISKTRTLPLDGADVAANIILKAIDNE